MNSQATDRNEQRAGCGEAAVTAYAKAKSGNQTDEFDFGSEEPQERLIDLLTDLRHWARQEQLDFDAAARMAESHFNCEVDEEGQAEEEETE